MRKITQKLNDFLILILVVNFTQQFLFIDSNKVSYAINCGSNKEYTTKSGIQYMKVIFIIISQDQFYRDGLISTYFNHPKVPSTGFRYTNDHELHRTERYGKPGSWLIYDLPISNPGHYVIILQFSEVNFAMVGKRVTNIYLGDTKVITNHDTLKAGRLAAVNLYLPITIKDNQEVIFDGHTACLNAFISSRLSLKFEPVKDNPKVDGIVVFKGTIDGNSFLK